MHDNVTTYESLGVRRLINCRGTITIISGSLILPEVKAAMMEAATGYVQLEELMEKVGARLGELMQCEFGLVTNGCAAAICQVTSACMAGDDDAKKARLPDTSGMKNEVLLLKSHQHGYNHAIRMTGASMIEVETAEEFEAAIWETNGSRGCRGPSWSGRGHCSKRHATHMPRRRNPFEIQGLRIGGLTWLGMEGEIFVRYQLDLEATGDEPVVLCGYANGCVGYVPTQEEYDRGGYEVDEAYKVYPSVLMIAPESDALIRRAAAELLQELHD